MNDKLSLTELQLIIRDSLYTALPGMYWVTAEISEIRENYSGHCYLELVEKHPDEINVRARLKGVIWGNRYRFIKALFVNTTGDALQAGLRILVKAKVEYHEVYGISLVINDIDPAFTIGEMAIKRQQIIRKLEEEGVFTMNKDLQPPDLPRKIAVISSKNAAGYTDFITHLSSNKYGYTFYTTLFEAAMQGEETEQSVTDALSRIADNTGLFDVVVIIRGGGSQTDLSWFDNYNIAYHITQFPLPVITGIGHEKDLSVTDLVAWRSEKTPTAVADFLIGSLLSYEQKLMEMASGIITATSDILGNSKRDLESARSRLIPLSKLLITTEKSRLSEMIRAIRTGIRSNLREKDILLENMASAISLLDPGMVLKRGYTITTSGGTILKSAVTAQTCEIIETKFSDGSVKSTIIKQQ